MEVKEVKKLQGCPAEWCRVDGSLVSCTESLKVLEENWREVQEHLQDVYEDAVLLGCGKAAFKAKLKTLIDELECDYEEKHQPIESKSKANRQ